MKCPSCSAVFEGPGDPLLRTVPCPRCGQVVDLVAASEGTVATRAPGAVPTLAATPAPTPAGRADPLLGRTFAGGRYRIEAILGVGGMGRVYRATQVALARPVAVKILSPELASDEHFRRRFDREAGTLAALQHPHIVTVHDMGVEDGTPYIVMALVDGPKGVPVSLRELLDVGPIEEDLALRVVRQTCSALEYAHAKGIVHRDIKPGNILLDAAGDVKVADFGIASARGLGGGQTLTTPGSVLGTLKYMAPEQLADAATADPRSDLYSLGVVFYEMLTGHAPMGRFEMPSETRKGLDRRLDAIVDRALRRAAEQRYQDAGQFARDISSITTERDYGRLHAGEASTLEAPPAARAAAAALAPAVRAAPPRGPTGPEGASTPEARPSAAASASTPRPPARRRNGVVAGIVGVLAVVGAAVVIFPGRFARRRPFAGPPGLGAPISPDRPPLVPPGPLPKQVPPPAPVGPKPAPPAAASPLDPEVAAAREDMLEHFFSDGVDAAYVGALRFRLRGRPGSEGVDVSALGAVRDALDRLGSGDAAAVVADVPRSLLETAASRLHLSADDMKTTLVEEYAKLHVKRPKIVDSVQVGADWLVATTSMIDGDDDAPTAGTALAVKEEGRWHVLLTFE